MARRFASIPLICAFVFVVCGAALVASASSPALLSAASRLKHGSAGSFDIALPLSGSSGIECRSVAGGVTLVLNFDQPISAAAAQITPTSAKISGSPIFSGNAVLVKLAGLQNATAYTLTLSNASNTGGEVSTVSVSLRTLLGDVNESGSVTAADVNTANGLVSSAAVTASNFAADVNLIGSVTKSDVTTIKQHVGTSVAGGAAGVGAVSAGPLLTPATSQPVLLVATMTPQADDAPNSLGTGSATLVLSADQTYATLRFSYSNLSTPKVAEHIHGPAATPTTPAGIIFDIDNPAPPSPTTQPLPDGSYQWIFDTSPTAQYTPAQIVNFILTGQTYINIHTSQYPGGEIRGQFYVATGSQTFTPPAAPPAITINPPTQFDAVRFLMQAAFGGTLTEVNALSNTHAANASTAINDWLTAQFNSQLPISYYPASSYNLTPGTAFPYGGTSSTYTTGNFNPGYVAASTQPTAQTYSPSSMYQTVFQRITQVQATNNNQYADTSDPDRITECWWHNAVAGTDQLRQRMATAYSEIFVISSNEGTINGNTPGEATWYDMLANDAFVNFRQLMYDFTLHPIMGEYLNMRGNNWSVGSSPNENYAREIMQLFTVGLYDLQPDSTLMLDSNGQPIPTYSQPQITNFAHVYTGWNTNGAAVLINTLPQPTPPATQPVIVPFNSVYQKPMIVTAGSHSQLAKQLLSYTGAALWGGGATTQPTDVVMIPANASQTVTTANTELNFALDNIFHHPNVGPFICKQLIQRLTSSNPSNGYVYRVAQVFDNDQYNGTNPTNPVTNQPTAPIGVRGNMKAVIQAILTDYEARSPALQAYQFNGKSREPLIRIVNILRPMHAFSKTGKWRIGDTTNTFEQTILQSPTVFNFFSPTYSAPGPISSAGDVSPELNIVDETSISNIQNMIYTGIYSNGSGSGFVGDNYGGDVYLNHSSTGTGLIPLLSTFGIPTVVNQIGILMYGAPLDTTTKNTVLNFISGNVSSSDVYGQVSAALHLISTSPRGATQE